MKTNGIPALIFHTLFVAFILAPLVVICLVAFTDKGYMSLPTDGFSLRWFVAILENQDFIDAFWVSLYIALGSATISLAVSVPVALAVVRHKFPGREGLTA